MILNHRLLNRVQLIIFLETFHSDEVRFIKKVHKRDARVDRLVRQEITLAHASDQNGAGATVTFRTDDFRTGQTLLVAQIFRHRHKGGFARKFNPFAVYI